MPNTKIDGWKAKAAWPTSLGTDGSWAVHARSARQLTVLECTDHNLVSQKKLGPLLAGRQQARQAVHHAQRPVEK